MFILNYLVEQAKTMTPKGCPFKKLIRQEMGLKQGTVKLHIIPYSTQELPAFVCEVGKG